LDKNPEIVDNMHSSPPINEEAKDNYSFNFDDSYELLVTGPNLRNKRPSFVPPLNLYGLPEYETSSDEEEDQA
jgi:hypothetical protein